LPTDADYLKFKELLESPGNDDAKTIDEYLEELEAKEKEMKCKNFSVNQYLECQSELQSCCIILILFFGIVRLPEWDHFTVFRTFFAAIFAAVLLKLGLLYCS
jgi:hypothetical protein